MRVQTGAMKLMNARASGSSLALIILLSASPSSAALWNTGTMIYGPVGEPIYIIPPCVDVDITIDGERTAHTLPPNCFMVAPIRLTWDSSLAQRRATGLIVYNTSVDSLVSDVVLFSLPAEPRDLGPLAEFAAWLSPAPTPAPSTLLFEGIPPAIGQQTLSLSASWEVTWEGDDCRSARGEITVEVQGVRTPPDAMRTLLMDACRVATSSTFLPAQSPGPEDVAAFSLRVLSDAPRLAELEPLLSVLSQIAAPATTGALDLSTPLVELPRAEPLAPDLVALPEGIDAANSITIGPPEADDPGWGSAGHAEGVMGPMVSTVQVDETLGAKSPFGAFEQATNGTIARSPQDAPLERSYESTYDPIAPREPRSTPNAPVAADAAGPRAHPDSRAPPPDPINRSPPSAWRPGPAPERPIAIVAPVAPAGPDLMPIVLAASAVGIACVAFALYQRVARPAGLEHEGRRALHAACTARAVPLTAGELAVACDMERKTAEYHLVYLARLGILRAHDAPDEPRRYALPAVRRAAVAQPVDERLIAALHERPGQSTADLAASVGITRWRAERRMRDLTLNGQARSMRADGVRRYEAV